VAETVKLPPLTMMAWLRYDLVERLLDGLGPITSILEIGCGQGAVGVRLAHRAPYLGVEPDEASYAVAAGRAAQLAGRARVLHGDSSLIDRDESSTWSARSRSWSTSRTTSPLSRTGRRTSAPADT
jgi:16S rRNA A1518/A1519 N6-dimethyltransferase RsmA/KsgA/DIM1 with predicted DNA glycosylase/AP lyase activity